MKELVILLCVFCCVSCSKAEEKTASAAKKEIAPTTEIDKTAENKEEKKKDFMKKYLDEKGIDPQNIKDEDMWEKIRANRNK